MSNEHWFIDETTQIAYTFAVVAVASNDVGLCRVRMRRLKPKNQKSIHFNNEDDPLRKKVIGEILTMPISAKIVTTELGGLQPRQRALSALAKLAVTVAPQRLILERESTQERADLQTLHRILWRSGLTEYHHVDRGTDPALWIADAVAWSYQRGGTWRKNIEPLIAEIHHV